MKDECRVDFTTSPCRLSSNSHNPKLFFSPVINEPFTNTTASFASFSARCVPVLTVSMAHRYVTNHHAITFRWEFQLLLIFQDDYDVSCRSIDTLLDYYREYWSTFVSFARG